MLRIGLAVDDVPSGDGSTTRSYSRYMLPIASSRGGGRYMFYLVDTIGVKFADEFNPSRQEIDAEFALVRLRKTPNRPPRLQVATWSLALCAALSPARHATSKPILRWAGPSYGASTFAQGWA